MFEIERVRMIRKRCTTYVLLCTECGGEADFISLSEAAALFEVDSELLNTYVPEHLWHIQLSDEGNLLCLMLFLIVFKRQRNLGQAAFCKNLFRF